MTQGKAVNKWHFLYRPGFWAAFLGTLPFSMLLLAIVPSVGIPLYLRFSHLYYLLPKLAFGSVLFPTREFGTIPDGAWAQILAMCLYALLGYVLGAIIRRAYLRYARMTN